MLSASEFRALLWHELKAVGLVPDRASFETCRSEVSRRGRVELDKVIAMAGGPTWRRVLRSLRRMYPEEDCIRVLGFGNAITEFAIAPLHLSGKEREEVVSLGALANLIVAAYDHMVDLRISRATLLPHWMLALASSHRGRLALSALARLSPAAPRLINRLVTGYFYHLGRLPYAEVHVSVYDAILRTIMLMYDAESETLRRGPGLLSERAVRRKAALPFVVMGLPAWLSTPEIRSHQYCRHLRWLYRLGAFFGWIDDAADLDADRHDHQPNLLNDALEKVDCQAGEGTTLARMIAYRGKLVVDDWYRHTEQANELPEIVRQALPICLVSWLGGLPSPA